MSKPNLENLSKKELEQCYIDSCELGDLATVKEILTSTKLHEIDINFKDGLALKICSGKKRKDVLYYLLFSKELKNNIDFTSYKEKLFIYSATEGYTDVIKLLVENPDPKKSVAYDYLSDIGISKAIENNHIELTSYFIQYYKNTEKLTEDYFSQNLYMKAYDYFCNRKDASITIMSLLINDLNIKETIYIERLKVRVPEIEFLFKSRELNKKLKEILPINSQDKLKKKKI